MQPKGTVKVSLSLKCYDKDGKLTSDLSDSYDQTGAQWAQAFQEAILALAVTMKDTSATNRSIVAGSAGSSPKIAFGTGTTASSFSDYSIQTQVASGSPVNATANALSGNTFTVTATWTNNTGGTVSVSELALYVTIATFTFCLTHDVFTGQNVSNGGQASATLTFTFT